ncbi:UDP-N-acetylmuramoyl-tripeptide--D-alanyl-D-alanine ligase [Flavobacterium rhizosphaerae]|uniref:UDP-N-acetylmuramoyl-tripeptide--D-alanyl-D-alanine ligase n=1 Tax=Flavobacterium rhizosphaerae TaxID=3163298 RepID=A0ABW8Z1D0_9FLAO
MTTEELYRYFTECSGICTDTRKISEGCMFIALKGENFDANAFAAEALKKGAKYAVIDTEEYSAGTDTLLVENSLAALQQLAKYHRRQLGLPVIALTGSNGKTTTKELINVVLSQKYSTKATIGNLNNHIGVPLTLLSFTKDTEIGIVEMGANHQKEIEFLCTLAEPNFGYITNFGKAHLEGFGGYEGIIKGKSELYDYLKQHTKTAFVNLDDTIQKEKTKDIPRITFSVTDYNCDVKIDTIDANPLVNVKYNGIHIQSNLIGLYNATNICAAIVIGHYFKISDVKIKSAIEGYTPSNNRSQLFEKDSNTIILDAYNANPSSMAAALENFLQLDAQNKVAILGDMFELGNESDKEHKKIIDLLHGKELTVYFAGTFFYSNRNNESNRHFYKNFEDLADGVSNTRHRGSTILIKGSRGMALERVLEVI